MLYSHTKIVVISCFLFGCYSSYQEESEPRRSSASGDIQPADTDREVAGPDARMLSGGEYSPCSMNLGFCANSEEFCMEDPENALYSFCTTECEAEYQGMCLGVNVCGVRRRSAECGDGFCYVVHDNAASYPGYIHSGYCIPFSESKFELAF